MPPPLHYLKQYLRIEIVLLMNEIIVFVFRGRNSEYPMVAVCREHCSGRICGNIARLGIGIERLADDREIPALHVEEVEALAPKLNAALKADLLDESLTGESALVSGDTLRDHGIEGILSRLSMAKLCSCLSLGEIHLACPHPGILAAGVAADGEELGLSAEDSYRSTHRAGTVVARISGIDLARAGDGRSAGSAPFHSCTRHRFIAFSVIEVHGLGVCLLIPVLKLHVRQLVRHEEELATDIVLVDLLIEVDIDSAGTGILCPENRVDAVASVEAAPVCIAELRSLPSRALRAMVSAVSQSFLRSAARA